MMTTKQLTVPTIEDMANVMATGACVKVWDYARKIAVEFGTEKSYGTKVYEDTHIRIETDYHTRIWVKLADIYVVNGEPETLVFDVDYKSGEWTSSYIDVQTFRIGSWIDHVMELGKKAQAEIDLVKWSVETKSKLAFQPINDDVLFQTIPQALDKSPQIKPLTLAEELELLIRRIVRNEMENL